MNVRIRSLFITLLWFGASIANWEAAQSACAAAEPAATTPHGPPNILYIMTDQQRYDALGAVSPALQTPALDRLAKEGMRFDRTYVGEVAMHAVAGVNVFRALPAHAQAAGERLWR